jgi:hypothetical protein
MTVAGKGAARMGSLRADSITGGEDTGGGGGNGSRGGEAGGTATASGGDASLTTDEDPVVGAADGEAAAANSIRTAGGLGTDWVEALGASVTCSTADVAGRATPVSGGCAGSSTGAAR